MRSPADPTPRDRRPLGAGTRARRSSAMGGRIVAVVGLAAGLLLAASVVRATVQDSPTPAPERAAPPSAEDVVRAVAALEKDPDLSGTRTVKALRWKKSARAAEPLAERRAWLREFSRWIDQSARLLVWVAAGIGALMLAVYLARLERRDLTDNDEFEAPSHVGSLDIRPESLPAEIGAAARALWDAGRTRPALALLYRGLLSRLAHRHRLPIKDSTTEGGCLVLTAAELSPPAHEYAERLVRAWQLAVYGHEPLPTPAFHALCDEFGRRVEGVTGPESTGGAHG